MYCSIGASGIYSRQVDQAKDGIAAVQTKYAIILPDGAADEPLEQFGGKTPLEAARIPNIDSIVEEGRIGTVRTVPESFAPGSDVATMSLLGYDVREFYSGRAPIEAVARKLPLQPDDIIFRCNLVNVTNGDMSDFTAGHIRSAEAAQIIESLNAAMDDLGVRFYPGVSYRNLMVIRDETAMTAQCAAPHDIPNEPIADYWPSGRGGRLIREIMDRARPIVAGHDVNKVRADLGEVPATDIWLWGQGMVPILPRFKQRFGVRGAVIAAVDLIRGLGRLVGWSVIDVPGATGYIDTDYVAKGRYAVEALDAYDLVAVHIEAPDEAGHMGDAAAKLEALERIDEHIVGPVLEKLRSFERWRILIAPDHPTPVAHRTHTDVPPPFCMAGTDVPAGILKRAFSERAALESDFHVALGHELMDHFLRR
ncbi:MAG: cofactor-independent phosphoglycerate mutase [Phycisphaerae bacterium]|nr:cofactor-independent phosphoglycerate mutase [Phycisphaerae bacterium]